MTSASASSTSRSVSGTRDERPWIHAEGQAVELLQAADVGHRLAGRTPFDIRLVAARGVGPDWRLGMRHDGGPSGPHGGPEQQLGVEPRRLRSGLAEPVRARLEERAGGLERVGADGLDPLSPPRPHRADRPGRP